MLNREEAMNIQELLKRKAQLETENDLLRSELEYLDQLMRMAGFTNGLETVKATAIDLIENPETYEFDLEQENDEGEVA
jgi:hypothetical protein